MPKSPNWNNPLRNSNNRIVTIGGGTGAPIVIKAFILAGFSNISAISTATDSGGRTGRMRTDERDRIISVGDLLRNLLALISPAQNHLSRVKAFTELADFTDGRYRNLGYQIYYGLLEKYHNNFLAVQKHFEQLLDIRFQGVAIPVTIKPTNISFSTSIGAVYHGEHELDRQSMSANTITKIWLDEPVPATPEAISAISQATLIIFCPGSIYGSVIVNLLPKGITAALKASKAKKILITNLVSNRNQTHRFSPLDYLRLFKKYTGLPRPFDLLLCPGISEAEFDRKYSRVAKIYATEHSYFLGWAQPELQPLEKLGIKVIRTDAMAITPGLSRIRHDPAKLAPLLKSIIL